MTLAKAARLGPRQGQWRKVLFNPVRVESRLVGVRFVFWPDNALPICFTVSSPARLKTLGEIKVAGNLENIYLNQLGIWMQKDGAGVKALNKAALRVESPSVQKQFFSEAIRSEAIRSRKKFAVGLVPCNVQAVIQQAPPAALEGGLDANLQGKLQVLCSHTAGIDGVRLACAAIAVELQHLNAEGFEYDPNGLLFHAASQLQDSADALAEAATLLTPDDDRAFML